MMKEGEHMNHHHLDHLSEREILTQLFTKMIGMESKILELDDRITELVRDIKQIKPILQETNSAVGVGFMEQRNLLSTIKEVAVDQDEQIAQVEWLNDKAEIHEKASLRLRQRMNLLERRVEFLEQYIPQEP